MEEIHESFINGQRKQAVRQIQEYGLYDFFADYKDYLNSFSDAEQAYSDFSDAVISYFRITER